ncbi:hypothetical protein ACSNOI_37015, partial [Actinomadura kijaniata]|uniref:hypothetical protein n=1 Tax=Actinomadura kijaniata TaxID=46161 RepID=UPI003F1D95A0
VAQPACPAAGPAAHLAACLSGARAPATWRRWRRAPSPTARVIVAATGLALLAAPATVHADDGPGAVAAHTLTELTKSIDRTCQPIAVDVVEMLDAHKVCDDTLEQAGHGAELVAKALKNTGE